MLGGEHSAPHPAASRRVGNLNCCLVHKSVQMTVSTYTQSEEAERQPSHPLGKNPMYKQQVGGGGTVNILLGLFIHLLKFTFCKLMQMH